MRTIALANQKGGCGKTTSAINLAGALASMHRRVLLIDLDPQAHATFGLGVTNLAINKSIYNVMTDVADRRRALNDCVVNCAPNLDIVPSNILLSTIEQELKDKEDAVSRLYQVIADSRLNYQYIIIDCPPSLGFLTFNALRAAEEVIVPIDMSAFSLMGVGKLLGMLELIKLKIHHAPQVNALATLFDRRTKYSQTMLDEITGFFRAQMLQTVIRVNVALKKAVAVGMSVIQFDKDSNGAKDYLALAEEIMKKESKEGAAEFDNAMGQNPMPQQPGGDGVFTVTPANFIHHPDQNVKEIMFTYEAPQAHEIFIVGDFNHWKISDDSRLARCVNGRWEKKMGLPLGNKFRYKFVVDGEWVIDPKNGERERNKFGTFDSVMKS